MVRKGERETKLSGAATIFSPPDHAATLSCSEHPSLTLKQRRQFGISRKSSGRSFLFDRWMGWSRRRTPVGS